MRIRPLFFAVLVTAFSPVAHAYEAAVVSANPAASKIGIEVLKKGGSAADAAIATAFALGVAEPYNSGIGGGGFFLYYEAKTKEFTFIDYRESAPAKASSAFYNSRPGSIEKGPYSVGVPGFVAGMEAIHHRFRKVSWPSLIQPSVDLARKGVPAKDRLEEKLKAHADFLAEDEAANAIFAEPFKKKSNKIVQSDLAASLDDIRTGGAQTFYRGELAQKLVQHFRNNGGFITAADLRAYRVYSRTPYSFFYKGYQVVSSPLPSSGGAGIDLLFKRTIINQVKDEQPFSARAYQLILEGLKDYMDYRATAMGDTTANIVAHTTHLCVIDTEGNIASMTNTLNSNFGSGVVAEGTGILLNNEMDDFSLDPASANRIRGARRPLSSMAPTIVLKKGEPILAIGTPGGVTIPQNIYQALLFHWNWKTPLGQAIERPKFYYSPKTQEIWAEEGFPKKIRRYLEESTPVKIEPTIGNMQALIIEGPKNTLPISDPRGEGKGYTFKK